MQISVSDAKSRLTDLVKRAEAGDDIVLTRHGVEVARIVPVKRKLSRDELLEVIDGISREGAMRITPGPCAARSQDFLYDERGLPK